MIVAAKILVLREFLTLNVSFGGLFFGGFVLFFTSGHVKKR